METVGNYLKGKREAMNMSLRDASRLTCIAEYYLGYIEKDEFDKLPQGPYIKGYITLYSEMIGTDVDKVLDLYDASNMQGKQIDDFRLKRPQQDGPSAPPFKLGISGYETPPSDAPASPPDQAAPSENSQAASSLKTDVIAFQHKCALKAARSFAYLAASSSKGMRWLDTVLGSIKANVRVVLPKTKGWLDTVIASIKASVRVVVPKTRGWLDTVVAPVTAKATAVVPKTKGWLDAVGAQIKNGRGPRPRAWLYLFLSLIGACILVLAGFGFYHLFLYEKPPLPSAALPQSQGTLIKSSLMTETEKSPVSSKAAAMPPEAGQPKANHETIDPVGRRRLTTDGRPPSSNDRRTNAGPKAALAGNLPTPSASALGVKVLKASVCAGIKGKMPVGVDTVFKNAVKRVYVWTQLEATVVPNQIRHIYYFNDHAVSDVVLDVGSAHWRTWSFITPSGDRNRGEWRVDITAADGKVLRRLYFEID